MIKTMVEKVFGTRQAREVKRLMPVVLQIHEHEKRLSELSEAELKGQTASFRARIAEKTGAL
jgi:preprotein translocase subunit SecA